MAPRAITPRFRSALERPFRLVLAGAAGGRVGTAAKLLSRAAILADLFAAQRSDYPVTVKTGYSLAEVMLAAEPIDDASVSVADALLVLAPEGRKQALAYLPALAPGAPIYTLPGIEAIAESGRSTIIDPAAAPGRLGKDWVATAVAAAVALHLDLIPIEALRAAVEGESDAAGLTTAIDAAVALAAGLGPAAG